MQGKGPCPLVMRLDGHAAISAVLHVWHWGAAEVVSNRLHCGCIWPALKFTLNACEALSSALLTGLDMLPALLCAAWQAPGRRVGLGCQASRFWWLLGKICRSTPASAQCICIDGLLCPYI